MKFISFYIIFFLKKWECEIDPAVHKLIYKKIDIDMAVSLSHKKKKKKYSQFIKLALRQKSA